MSRGRYCNTICMCGLSLAWVTSENSTMLLESDSSWLTLAGPYPMLPRLSAPVSGVDCPCPFFHANCLLLLASLLSSRQLPSAGSRRQLPRPGLPSTASLASPSHFRIRREFMSKNPLSGFAPKQTRLLWRPTHIVLQMELFNSTTWSSVEFRLLNPHWGLLISLLDSKKTDESFVDHRLCSFTMAAS